MSDEEDYDVVLDTLQKAYDRRNDMVNKNSEMGMFNIMDNIRLDQMDELSKAIDSWKTRNFLSTPEPEQDDEPVGILRHNGQFELQRMVGIPIGQPMKLYEHPAPRPEFVRLSEEEIMEITGDYWAFGNMAEAIQDALIAKNNPTILSLNDTISANSRDLGHE